jgi:N-hydroxyarylamine O-acetyltransferase
MVDEPFDVDAWLARIGYAGPRAADLQTLRGVIAAHATTIPFENFDVLLGRVPQLDLGALQRKLIAGGRGGYCFEHNMVLRAGLLALGFDVASLLARVIRGLGTDAPRAATHMVLRVTLPEGAFLADVGFGGHTPTAPLAMRAGITQHTPHEPMRLLAAGDDLVLQVQLGDGWDNIYRVLPYARLDADYEVANWFTATHPDSPFANNLIVARAAAGGLRHALFNGRVSTRHAATLVDQRMLDGAASYAAALRGIFGLILSEDDLAAALAALDRNRLHGGVHLRFA